MALFISSKNNVQDTPTRIAFLQLERWANNTKHNPITFNTNWSSVASPYPPCTWNIDLTSCVRLHGQPVYAGGLLTSGSSNLVATLPATASPLIYIRRFSITSTTGAVISPG